MSKVLELYGISTKINESNWNDIIQRQICPYLQRRCPKVRKSTPDVTIGSCSVLYSRDDKRIMICPYRLLERRQIFLDCLHLLTLHEPGNELHIVSEVTVPGGSVDYCLVSVRDQRVVDFVGIELQTLDTTGTVWPARQRFLQSKAIAVDSRNTDSAKSFGMNWKMTAKTILMQLNHKIRTFENVHKHLVLIAQNHLVDYMQREFQFDHIANVRLGDSLHIHSYMLNQRDDFSFRLGLGDRYSTDADGIAQSLGLQADPNVALEHIVGLLEAKISSKTLFTL